MAWFNKKKESKQSSDDLTWSPDARAALDSALGQAPVPAVMKKTVRKQLISAAERATREAGRSQVTPQDMMAGMLANMPANVREQVEAAMKSGNPKDLEQLQKRLRGSG